MTIYTASSARQNFFQLIKSVIKSHKPVHVTTKEKNVVILSEDDYNAMQETLYLMSIPGMRDSIKQAMQEPYDDCAEELDW